MCCFIAQNRKGALFFKAHGAKIFCIIVSADGGRTERQMVNITSNIFILRSKAKQKTNAYEATQRGIQQHPFFKQEATDFLRDVILITNRCTENY